MKKLVTALSLVTIASSAYAQGESVGEFDHQRNGLRVSLGLGVSEYNEISMGGASQKIDDDSFQMGIYQLRLEKNYTVGGVLPLSTAIVYANSGAKEESNFSDRDYERNTLSVEQKAFYEVSLSNNLIRPYVGFGLGINRFVVEEDSSFEQSRAEFSGVQTHAKVGFEVIGTSNWSFDAFYSRESFSVNEINFNGEEADVDDLKLKGQTIAVSVGYSL